jgi:hypothetical protein
MTHTEQQSCAAEIGLARARRIRAPFAHSTTKVQTVCISRFIASAIPATTCGVLVPLLPKARPVRPQPVQPVPPAPSPPPRPRPAAQGVSAPSEPAEPPKQPLTWPEIPATIPPTPQHPVVTAQPRVADPDAGKPRLGGGWPKYWRPLRGAGDPVVVEQRYVCHSACAWGVSAAAAGSYEPRYGRRYELGYGRRYDQGYRGRYGAASNDPRCFLQYPSTVERDSSK